MKHHSTKLCNLTVRDKQQQSPLLVSSFPLPLFPLPLLSWSKKLKIVYLNTNRGNTVYVIYVHFHLGILLNDQVKWQLILHSLPLHLTRGLINRSCTHRISVRNFLSKLFMKNLKEQYVVLYFNSNSLFYPNLYTVWGSAKCDKSHPLNG